ncbi:hypothetical protein JXJ21_21475 [candidate division KSB1 bacterium]|nr:hypothetical protein [candidate division KSB1 bacterium]
MAHETDTHFNLANSAESNDIVPQGDTISTEAVVNMLVQKGICTVDEIYMLEGRIREKNKELAREGYSTLHDIGYENGKHSGNHSAVKRWFGKRRWTRRIGAALFGWKWKKVRRSTQIEKALNEGD